MLAALSGCTHSTGVVPIGENMYRIMTYRSSDAEGLDIISLTQAETFAAKEGKYIRKIKEKTSYGFDALGDFVHMHELIFRLVNQPE